MGEVEDMGRVETVYNLKGANYHTYLVGSPLYRLGDYSRDAIATDSWVLPTADEGKSDWERGGRNGV
jgi:hypothetical protein